MGEHEVKAEGEKRKTEMRRAVFLDRDGVISRSIVRDALPFAPKELKDFEILPEAPEACRRLKQAGFLLIVATNQPDVGRGTMKKEIVEAMHAEMLRQAPIDRVDVCYHPGKGQSNCDCRKPKAGLLLNAARELHIDLAQSWMVGDRWRDIDCGHAAGCRTIFVDRGYAENLNQAPDFRVKDLAEAASVILSHSK
jgi:D-glycero-D-manno-heptose 1,7-bisphosphate phosphatase